MRLLLTLLAALTISSSAANYVETFDTGLNGWESEVPGVSWNAGHIETSTTDLTSIYIDERNNPFTSLPLGETMTVDIWAPDNIDGTANFRIQASRRQSDRYYVSESWTLLSGWNTYQIKLTPEHWTSPGTREFDEILNLSKIVAVDFTINQTIIPGLIKFDNFGIVASVPESSTLMLAGLGIMFVFRRRL